MKSFECTFEHPGTGKQRVIEVEVTAVELAKASDSELYQHAFALKHAYRVAPAGFLHVRDGIRALPIH
jgi:hypothetical protein